MSQSESLRNLIVSEAADWQVLTLRLAVQLQALKSATTDDETLDGNSSSKHKQVSPLYTLQATPFASVGVTPGVSLWRFKRMVRVSCLAA